MTRSKTLQVRRSVVKDSSFKKLRTIVKTSVESSSSLNWLVKYRSAEDAATAGADALIALVLVRDERDDTEAPMLGWLLIVVVNLPERCWSNGKKENKVEGSSAV